MPRLSPLCVSPVCRGPMPQCIKVGVNWLKISWLWRKLDWNMKKELRVLQSEKVLHHWHWTNRSITGTTVVEVLMTACLYFLLLSVSVEGFETRQHRHASWHHPHAEIPHTGVWVPGKKCTQQYTNSSSSSSSSLVGLNVCSCVSGQGSEAVSGRLWKCHSCSQCQSEKSLFYS